MYCDHDCKSKTEPPCLIPAVLQVFLLSASPRSSPPQYVEELQGAKFSRRAMKGNTKAKLRLRRDRKLGRTMVAHKGALADQAAIEAHAGGGFNGKRVITNYRRKEYLNRRDGDEEYDGLELDEFDEEEVDEDEEDEDEDEDDEEEEVVVAPKGKKQGGK